MNSSSTTRACRSHALNTTLTSLALLLLALVVPAGAEVGNDNRAPDVGANGSFYIVWRREDIDRTAELRAAGVNGSGTVVDPGGFAVGAAYLFTDAAVTNGPSGRVGVSYDRYRTSPYGAVRTYLRTIAPK